MPGVVVLFVAFPVSGDVSGVADGQKMKIRGIAELVANFERSGLLAFDANRVDAVDDLDFAGFAKLTHDAERVIEIAFDGNSGCAIHQRLRQFAERNLPVGQKNHALHLCARGVGRG